MNEAVPGLIMVRRIKAPPATVFEAWTRPEMLARWWGPHHTMVLSAEADARVGGTFRVTLVEDAGARHAVSGTYAGVVPGERLVFSWACLAQHLPAITSVETLAVEG